MSVDVGWPQFRYRLIIVFRGQHVLPANSTSWALTTACVPPPRYLLESMQKMLHTPCLETTTLLAPNPHPQLALSDSPRRTLTRNPYESSHPRSGRPSPPCTGHAPVLLISPTPTTPTTTQTTATATTITITTATARAHHQPAHGQPDRGPLPLHRPLQRQPQHLPPEKQQNPLNSTRPAMTEPHPSHPHKAPLQSKHQERQ